MYWVVQPIELAQKYEVNCYFSEASSTLTVQKKFEGNVTE